MNKKKQRSILTAAVLILIIAAGVNAQTKEELKNQVETLEKQVFVYEKIIDEKQSQTKTLKNELEILKQDIAKKELEIKRTNIKVKNLNLEIAETEDSIKESSERIEATKKILVSYLRDLYKLGRTDLIAMVLNSPRISHFFDEIKALENINSKAKDALGKYKTLKIRFEEEKANLEEDRYELLNLNSLLEIEKKNLGQENKQKDQLLKKTKGEEKKFQVILKDKKKDLATLKSQLFYLEATGISAEEALKHAELAAAKTGIRASYLLAVLEVETGRQFENGVLTVGTNLGSGHWKKDMYDCYVRLGKRTAAERQKQAYFAITNKLNYDPDKMPVSRAPRYGCGGAIGPAQFLPGTWLLYESRVAELIGKNPPDPWKIEAAFMAAALFLSDSGADKKTTTAERTAAKIYLSGSASCQKYICNLYANNVISLAAIIDRNI